MNFKQWLLQLEAIDANTKDLLLKAKAPKDELDAFVKELEDEPNLIDKKTAFQRFQSKFNIQKKTKDEDGQRQFFANVPNTTEEELKTYDYYKDESPQSLKEMMELLRKFIEKKLITLKFENNKPVLIRNTLQGEQKFDTPDFTRFMSSLHGVQASLQQYKGKGNYFNPIEEELNHQNNLVAKGDNVWVFKGYAPDLCRIYGKGHPWCISSSTSAAHWFSYRVNHHQTQYFVFDFNKDENDPARYVNPGVAPEGKYSEWVDARNQHKIDPEDRKSHVGINGYESINEYKKYLASKGIPLDTWTTTPPEEWEKRLSNYDDNQDFAGAKNDDDPRVFPMYLKIVSSMDDSDFETLDKEQKKEFILGKTYLTDKQFSYAVEKFKGEYINSLDLNGKIWFANKTNDQDLLLKLAQNKNLYDYNVYDLLLHAEDKEKIAELLQKEEDNISKLRDLHVYNLLYDATDKDQMAKILGSDNINKLDNYNVYNLLRYAPDEDQMAKILGSDNINKLSSKNVYSLIFYANDKDQMAKILGSDNINKISDDDLMDFLRYAPYYKDKMAIIQYKKEFSGMHVHYLLNLAKDKEQIAKILGTDNINKLSDDNVYHLLRYAPDEEQMANILGSDNIKKLSSNNVIVLLLYAINQNKMAEILADNINKLSNSNVLLLFRDATDKKQMAQIIDKYHQKKTPEIQEEIDKYLS